ncbi:MAG: hypothetical protein PHI97_26065 [Desulfobulbus sp.]|nr:hypothetical protein [Desulfobulbus sp.]
MLQISTGKFFETTDPEQLYETTHRGVLYTNYNFFDDRISTCAGDILPVARWGDFQTITCEVIERLPKPNRDPMPGDVVSAGGQDTMIQDFAALVSFSLNAVCTPDQNLARQLITTQRPPLGTYALPRDYISRMFDTNIQYRVEDLDTLKSFVFGLMGLKRKWYSAAIRAVRRYVTAMHRLSDDLDMSYALLVASIESLAQEFDGFIPIWDDIADRKRIFVDKALESAPNEICERVREAILKSEHAALKRRFCEFTNKYLQSCFFRDESYNQQFPAGRSEIEIALKYAYDVRSAYIHALKPLPENLVMMPNFGDIRIIGHHPYLTFNGLARIARHVIFNFIEKSPKVDNESFNFTSEYPGMITVEMASEYWIGNPNDYSPQTSRKFLNGFISQIASSMTAPTSKVTDMRSVMHKIQELVPSLAKLDQKMPMLTLYMLFCYYLHNDERKEFYSFLTPYLHLFDQPTIDSLIAHLMVHIFNGGSTPGWGIEKNCELLVTYISQRFHKKGLNAGPLFGAALVLWIAEMFRSSGNEKCARELISYAIEEFPQQKFIYDFESKLTAEPTPEINCVSILLPHLETKNM